MKRKTKIWMIWALVTALGFSLVSFQEDIGYIPSKFPYRQAGLTDKQAAAHLLSRFSYGAKSGQIEEVLKLGPERWFALQLEGKLDDKALNRLLEPYDGLKLSNTEVAHVFPSGGLVRKMAFRDGAIEQDSSADDKDARNKDKIAAYMKSKGLRQQSELFQQFISQKIVRSAYSNNQLHEILTEFWFNHFNVSLTKNQCAPFIPRYEQDAIRPFVTGKFGDMLLATAKSPAMLFYLDNATSSASTESSGDSTMQQKPSAKKNKGLNENYAREVMELHTLGVDGGYTQNDVTEAARVLTGWTTFPLTISINEKASQKPEKAAKDDADNKKEDAEDGFHFIKSRHDNGEKTVLGKKFAAGGGYGEGVDLLNMLAHHPSTAKFICKKLAVRFVNDTPPQSLIDKMAKTFKEKDGDIGEVLTTMVSAPEFWAKTAVREKTKSPFELAISTVRGLDIDVQQPYQLYNWTRRMGQDIYRYQAPTGFPDYARYWINTGALLNRMNFGLAIAAGKIAGAKVDLLALNDNHEPESSEKALLTYGNLIMPERDLSKTVTMITPLLNDPNLAKKVGKAASKSDTAQIEGLPATNAMPEKYMLAQVVGILIGSPEFQRK